jgi:AcrR family transcriptional regulator
MPKSAEATRDRILKAAYTQFRREGFTRVGVDEIAAAANVTKRTLYYHFRSKDELLAAVFESQHQMAVAAFRTFGDSLTGPPEKIVEAMFDQIMVWSSRPRWTGSGFTRLAMELADMPGHPARKIAMRHKAILEDCLDELLEQAKMPAARERAREVWLLSEGAISLVLIHNDPRYAKAAGEAAKRLVGLPAKKVRRRVREVVI